MGNRLFSLGHSCLPFAHFARLLRDFGVNAVADVRSAPFSKQSPWFSQKELKAGLRDEKIAYVFLGEELGGRPKANNLFDKGVADYAAMAKSNLFESGIQRLLQGLNTHTIAMICSERDPLHCHRCLLVGRHLEKHGICTHHIQGNGSLETQQEAEDRLLREEKLERDDFLYSRTDRLDEAYRRRNKQVAYSITKRPAELQWPKI